MYFEGQKFGEYPEMKREITVYSVTLNIIGVQHLYTMREKTRLKKDL